MFIDYYPDGTLSRYAVRQGYKFSSGEDESIVIEKARMLAKTKISDYLKEAISKVSSSDFGDAEGVKNKLKLDLESTSTHDISGIRDIGTIYKKNRIYVELGISKKSIYGTGDIQRYMNEARAGKRINGYDSNADNRNNKPETYRSRDYDNF